ncbi:twin-arginine translocation signal domain-containing protein, partial [Vibrio campbellii]
MVSRNFSRRDFLKMTAGGVVVASTMPSVSWASLPNEPRVL